MSNGRSRIFEILLGEFSVSLEAMMELINESGELRVQFNAVLHVLEHLPDVLGGMIQIVRMPADTRSRFDDLSRFLRDLSVVLRGILQLAAIPEDGISPFNALVLCLMNELSEVYRRMLQLANLPEEAISRFENLILCLRVYSYLYKQRLETSDVVSERRLGLSFLRSSLNQLSHILQRELEFQFRVVRETIEMNTLSYKYKKIQRSNGEVLLEECSVCMDNLEEDEEARRLPCMHLLHMTCADKWLRTDKRCPVCRLHIEDMNDDLPLHRGDCRADLTE